MGTTRTDTADSPDRPDPRHAVSRDVFLPGRGLVSVWEVPGPPDAPVLVLLHGLGGTGRLNWFPSVRTLASQFHLLIPDHRGHGRGIRTKRFRLEDCADDVVALADALEIESMIAVGYSMGGPIATLAWRRHADRIRGLVLCATAARFVRPEIRGLATTLLPGAVLGARLVPDLVRNHLIDRMVSGVPTEEGRARVRRELEGSDPATVVQAARAVARFSSHEWIGGVDVPAAVIVMTEDELVPPRRQRRLADAIPDAKVYEVAANHLACVTAVDRFVPTLFDACTYVDGRAATIAAAAPAAHRA